VLLFTEKRAAPADTAHLRGQLVAGPRSVGWAVHGRF
jgi:hypothetical protein